MVKLALMCLKFFLMVGMLLSSLYVRGMEPNRAGQKKLFLFVGLPGSGKTTVCQKLAEKHMTIAHQSIGDMLRTEAKKDTERGRLVNGLIMHGRLVPYEISLNLLDDFFKQNQKPIIVLDGYQGTKEYIEPFDTLLKQCNIKLIKVFSFDISVPLAVSRSCVRMRSDDTPEALRSRIESRLKSIGDIQAWYKAQGCLIHINAEDALDTVVSAVEHGILAQ